MNKQIPSTSRGKSQMNKQILTTAAAVVLAFPSLAAAHVTVQPSSAPAGAFTVQSVRVPNESDTASTTQVDLRLPGGFTQVSYQRVDGWSVRVYRTTLATPVQTEGGAVTEQVSRIRWTARSRAAGIAPGQFQDFPLSVRVPGEAGDTLTFRAVQTYSDGTVARWIGAPSSDMPAPTVAVTAAVDREHGSDAAEAADDGGDQTLAIIALVVGGLALAAAAAGLAVRRR